MDIQVCGSDDFDAISETINAAAQAYRGVIPADRWTDPYMASDDLRREVAEGVVFWGCFEAQRLVGAMGLQHVEDVTLIRHAYVRPERQREGIAGALLARLRLLAQGPLLVGTWQAAKWAIDFYEHHGFSIVSEENKNRLLRRYWSVPERQIEESVVLADESWFNSARHLGSTTSANHLR
jgi:GNAT superfamily N-acetyltransferase